MAFLSDEATFRTLDPVRPFSYAFLHAEMPGIEGLDLLHWIAAAPQLRHVPVILLGSSTDPEEVRRVFRLGANSYLLKPLGFEPLVRLVESMHLFWNSWAPTESA
jgi:CheY-like chemotaxis protein